LTSIPTKSIQKQVAGGHCRLPLRFRSIHWFQPHENNGPLPSIPVLPAVAVGANWPSTIEAIAIVRPYRRFDVEFGVFRTPEYLRMNPNGLAPTIRDDGIVILESNDPALSRDLYGDGALYPEGLGGRFLTGNCHIMNSCRRWSDIRGHRDGESIHGWYAFPIEEPNSKNLKT
jgi:hypothetical protein